MVIVAFNKATRLFARVVGSFPHRWRLSNPVILLLGLSAEHYPFLGYRLEILNIKYAGLSLFLRLEYRLNPHTNSELFGVNLA
jgi:hypothetical protein